MDPVTVILMIVAFLLMLEALWQFIFKPRENQQYVNDHRMDPGVDMLADTLGVQRPERSPEEQRLYEFNIQISQTINDASTQEEALRRVSDFVGQLEDRYSVREESKNEEKRSELPQNNRSIHEAASHRVRSNSESKSEVKEEAPVPAKK